jgi:hypothetical protein
MSFQSLVPSRLTSFHTLELSSTTPLVPPGGAVLDREGSNEFLVSGKALWQLLFWQFHNLAPSPAQHCRNRRGKADQCRPSNFNLGQQRRMGNNSISSSIKCKRRLLQRTLQRCGAGSREQGT